MTGNHVVKAWRDAELNRRVIAAKGFKRPGADLQFKRVDADLYFDYKSGKWVCDVYTTADGVRGKLLTRKANEMLNVLLKSFI